MGKLTAAASAAEAATHVSPLEVEIKMALPAERLRRLRRHPVVSHAPRTCRRLRTVYFDTPQATLFKQGIAVRLRRHGRQWIQTVKGQSDTGGLLAQRFEWETPVVGRNLVFTALPPDIQPYFRPEVTLALKPCFETDVWRETWQVIQDGTHLEVAFDRGEVRTTMQSLPISEIELELKSGTADVLFKVAEQLATDLPVYLEPRSKAERGYELVGALSRLPIKAHLPVLDFDGPAATAFQRIVRSCMQQFEANLSGFVGATEPDPEYIHQMRVALRRMRAAFGLLRFMDGVRPDWLDELKWLMGELAAARDWDVFVTETLVRVRKHIAQPEQLADLTNVAENLRRMANARAQAALRSPRLVRLWFKAEQALATLPPATISTAVWAQTALQRRYRRLLRLGEHLQSLTAVERHALRIAAKKLRYGAEFFAGQHPKTAQRFIRRLAALQDVLGVLNDAAVTAHCLHEIRQSGGPALGEAIGLVGGFLACEQAYRLEELKQLWRDFHRTPPYWTGKA